MKSEESHIRTILGRLKPSFMILGVQKGGTSSLFFYLNQHPALQGAREKELHYFDRPDPTPAPEYHKQYPFAFYSNKISYEATPRYLYYPGCAKKLFDYNPELKFIVMLRDPVKRAYSAWNMYRQMSERNGAVSRASALHEKYPEEALYPYFYADKFPDFEKAIALEMEFNGPMDPLEPSLLRRGYYKEQLLYYFGYFPREAFLFLDFDQLKQDLSGVLKQTAAFLNIAPFEMNRIKLDAINKREYIDTLNPDTYQRLLVHFSEMNQGLEELIGYQPTWQL